MFIESEAIVARADPYSISTLEDALKADALLPYTSVRGVSVRLGALPNGTDGVNILWGETNLITIYTQVTFFVVERECRLFTREPIIVCVLDQL